MCVCERRSSCTQIASDYLHRDPLTSGIRSPFIRAASAFPTQHRWKKEAAILPPLLAVSLSTSKYSLQIIREIFLYWLINPLHYGTNFNAIRRVDFSTPELINATLVFRFESRGWYIYIYIKMRFPRKYLLPLMASIYASPVSCYTTSRYLARIKLHAIYFPGCCELCVRDRGREQRCVVSEREFFFFVIFFRSWFSGEMERRMNEIRFVFRFMNLDNRVAFVWSLCDFFFFFLFLCSRRWMFSFVPNAMLEFYIL